MAAVEGRRNWADARVEDDDDDLYPYVRELPPPKSRIEGNTKITTEYIYDDDTEKVKAVTRHYKIERIKVSKSIANRKNWKKYGMAAGDPPGPNPANTICCEEVVMQFISSKDEEKMDSGRDSEVNFIKFANVLALRLETVDKYHNPVVFSFLQLQQLADKNIVKCRNCGMDHFTLKCPYKDKFDQMKEREGTGPSSSGLESSRDEKKGGKYVPPSMRDGATKRPDNVYSKSNNEANTIRVTNLPEDIQDSDIKELIQPIIQNNRITRIFLAKDKYTGHSKGFAFVSFDRKDDAAKVIKVLNGYGYANLILNVEWAKPSTN